MDRSSGGFHFFHKNLLKMPESSKMTWNNYRSGKETGSSAISITSMAIPSKW
jgi:hypothetical protein